MRKLLVPTIAALVAAVVTAGFAIADGGPGTVDNRHFTYAIGLWGDVPYSDVQATTGVPRPAPTRCTRRRSTGSTS